jgi:alpha-beta hydrolase superfamily lysophospholipase
MKHITDQFTGAHGEAMFFQNWQPDKQAHATLVIVHGLSDHCNRYTNLVNGLVPRGIAIYIFDQLGHGRSPGSRGHIDSFIEYREDLHAFMQLVAGIESEIPLFLMGHSMGGLIVLDYGLQYPQDINGVIASAPHLGDPPVSPVVLTLGRLLSGIWPGLTLDNGLDKDGISRDPGVVQAYQDDPLVHGKGTPRLSTELSIAVANTQANAANFQPPLLIYHGSADRLTSPEASRRFYDKVSSSNKRYISYEGGYHEGHNDLHRERVIIDVGQWMEEQIRLASRQPQEHS